MAMKRTSEVITIGFSAPESAANTFSQTRVDLQLNPLDNEVFVVLAVNLDQTPPDALAGITTRSSGALTTTSRTAMPSLADSATLAVTQQTIEAAGFVDGGVGFAHTAGESPPTQLDRDWETC